LLAIKIIAFLKISFIDGGRSRVGGKGKESHPHGKNQLEEETSDVGCSAVSTLFAVTTDDASETAAL
jgi:hypothetical protein